MITIYVPTYGRGAVQPTYDQLSAAKLNPVLVVDTRDPYPYAEFRHLRGNFTGIGDKRHELLKMHFASKTPFAMLDDDLVLLTMSNAGRVSNASSVELRKLFKVWLPKMLKTYAQIGLHQRAFVNYQPRPYVENGAGFPYRVQVYNPALWKRLPRPCPTCTGEDVWTWHELVAQGLSYAIITDFCTGDRRHRTVPSHFTDEAKTADFYQLVYLMNIAKRGMVRRTKKGISIAYSRLTKHYLKEPTS